MDRRGFLSAILVAGCAPAIVRAESLMRCRGIIVPPDCIWLASSAEWVAFHTYMRGTWPNLRVECNEENYKLMLQIQAYVRASKP